MHNHAWPKKKKKKPNRINEVRESLVYLKVSFPMPVVLCAAISQVAVTGGLQEEVCLSHQAG